MLYLICPEVGRTLCFLSLGKSRREASLLWLQEHVPSLLLGCQEDLPRLTGPSDCWFREQICRDPRALRTGCPFLPGPCKVQQYIETRKDTLEKSHFDPAHLLVDTTWLWSTFEISKFLAHFPHSGTSSIFTHEYIYCIISYEYVEQ